MKVTVRVLGGLFLISVALAAIGLSTLLTRNPDTAFLGVFLWIPICIGWFVFGSLYILLAVHEAGHYLAGKLLGLEFRRLRVGRLEWSRVRGQLKFSEVDTSWLRGLTVMIPSEGALPKGRYLLYIAAGSIANLLVAAAFALFAATNAQAHPIATGMATFVAIFSGVMGLANLVPHANHGQVSDGMQISLHGKDNDALQRSLALSRIMRTAQDLVPPETWSKSDLQLIVSEPNDTRTYPPGLLYNYYREMLRGDDDAAGDYIEAAILGTPPTSGWFMVVRLNAAIFLGYVRRDGVRAQDCLSAVSTDQFGKSYAYFMAVASTRLAQGRLPEAAVAGERALAIISSELSDSVYPQEIEMTERILSEAKAGV